MRESLRRLASEDGDGMERRGRSVGTRRVRVELMLGEHITVDVERKARGSDLLDQICDSLDLLEKDYFGLLYTQRGDPRVWLDLNRRLSKTFRNEPWDVRLAVKFYPPEPSELTDDATRYQIALAVRRDLMEDGTSWKVRPLVPDEPWAVRLAVKFYPLESSQLTDDATRYQIALAVKRDLKEDEPWDVRLAVKFYPPEPSELTDDATRYQIALAVRRDLMEGRLTCSQITYALLSSYVLQAELGDFEESHDITTALHQHNAVPVSVISPELEANIDELYRKHKGQTPAEAELNYLETAKRLSLYGAELHAATDCQDVPIALGVCHSGVAVYRDGLLMNRFPWAKITKICYNKRLFTLRLRAGEFDEFETILSFKLAATSACKKLWRCSVEHHMFFRRESPVPVERIPGFARLGSRRLSCRRTLRQMRAAHDHTPTAA
ncbi:hypothetical protein PYW07_009783 [Mythimna separata]|uniref:FERM domain-containing protein n=1 Tax=Mythimna separata TaxID=271217 RepID=A0AAD7YC55_MYTSE|nr:hypothetical protein PYW07_009783 [Mythimna separata]